MGFPLKLGNKPTTYVLRRTVHLSRCNFESNSLLTVRPLVKNLNVTYGLTYAIKCTVLYPFAFLLQPPLNGAAPSEYTEIRRLKIAATDKQSGIGCRNLPNVTF